MEKEGGDRRKEACSSIRFEFLDLLRSVSMVSLLPRWLVGSILIIAGGTIHVVTPRSAFMFFISASSTCICIGLVVVLRHSYHLSLTFHTSLLCPPLERKSE